MSKGRLIAGLPLAIGSAMVSSAVQGMVSSGGVFILEWVGTFLAFYGLSCLIGLRMSMVLSGVVLVAGSHGDMILLGALTSLNWALVNYVAFIHSTAGPSRDT